MSFLQRLFAKPRSREQPVEISGGPLFRGIYTGQTLDGLWVRQEADARNAVTVATWCTMKGASEEIVTRALAADYRVVPNRSGGDGGWFCMFGPEWLDPQ